MKNDGGPAFPHQDSGNTGLRPGMTLRDWFAGQIAAGMAAFSGTSGISYGPDDIAGRAYQISDALLAHRAKDGA
ncbi:MAG: hypothetical protein J0H10_17055 [Alphaproteobacteria bacterium]|nr:hypothetical protein [Alphaproteobacteria bacterium]